MVATTKTLEEKKLQTEILVYELRRTFRNIFQGIAVRREFLTQMLIQGAQWS